MRNALFLSAFLLLSVSTANAEPILLSSWSETLGFGSGTFNPPVVDGEIEFSYNLFFNSIPDPEVGGAGFSVHSGFYGFLDFNESNTPGFAAATALLTNGVDDSVYAGTLGTKGSWPTVAHFFIGRESNTFDMGSEAVDWNIQFLRLVVDNLTISEHLRDTEFGPHLSVSGETAFRWEIWGEGSLSPPSPNPVPEPSSLMLIGSGLAIAMVKRRVRRR